MSLRTCSHCGAGNDVTRVYCAECGARLPEEVVAEAPAAAVAAQPAVGSSAPPLRVPPPRRRAPGKVKPAQGPGAWTLVFKMVFSTAVFAAVLAAVIQMAREPAGIPAVAGRSQASAGQTQSTLGEMAASAKPISWMVNQQALNEYLETAIRMEPTAAGSYGLAAEFQRAFVRLGTGTVALGLEQKFLARNVYFLLEVAPEPAGGGIRAKVMGGAIGRLPVHPRLLPVFMRLFEPTLAALSPTLALVSKASSVAIQPEDVTLQWEGSNAPSR